MAGVNSAALGAFLSNNKEQSGVDPNSSSPTPVWTAGTGQPTPAVEACWQMVEAGQLAARRRRNTLRLFHQGRTLLLKHLPRDVTEHEIREMLLSRGVQTGSITLSSGSGAGPNWARAGLVMMTGSVTTAASAGSQLQDHQLDGFGSTVETIDNIWEDWKQTARDRLDGCTIRGHKVSLCPSPTENLLCVARLPRDLHDEEFRDLVAAYGEIRRSFLLYSDKTGESKGYGFVEYASREGGQRAKTNLDGRRCEDQLLACDWLDPSIVTMAGLHSKLLYVDCLPDGFRDMSQFRKLFSQVANPPYCQIALKGGAPQDWGLVEFSQAQEAEDTMRALDGKLFYNAPLRLNFFIPGVRAINIYMKLINETCQNRGKEALLPEPPSDTVFHQLQNLTKQNPAFVHSLQNIILTQIQHLNSSNNSASSSHPGNNNCPSNGSGSSRSHHQYQQQPSPGQQASNASLAASAQAALSMLLAAQQPTGCNPTVKNPPQPVPPPIPPVSRIPVGTAYHHQHQHRSQQTFPNHGQPMGSTGVQPPALNINVPPPPFYQAQSGVPPPPPPPPSVIQRPPPPSTNLQPVEQLQQTLSALLGTLSSAVQSLSSPQPPASTPQQTAAGALLGLLLQMVQQQPQPVSPPLTISTHEMAGYNHVGNGGVGGGLLTVAAPPSGLPTYLHHCNSYPPPPIQQPLSSPSSSSASSVATSTLTASGTWNHVLGQVRTLSSGPSSLGSTGSRGSSPTSSSSPSTSPARHVHPPHMNNASSFVTPVQQQGTKRKYNGGHNNNNNNNHVLPSPEPSPEANYVGQHSQGLGGHYADSYFKRKKRN